MTCDGWFAETVGSWQLPANPDETLFIIREYSENEQEVSLYELQDLPVCSFGCSTSGATERKGKQTP